ncbi:NHL repeat containing protein [Candidatus Atelocyanobacterium thalassae]|uniref:NHL repeat protein n=2 Tax=Candidatus Atelocyanobacterium thalassae TaxID=713887 RepID=A0A086CFR1_9CHRO|nr:NHL repeat containing protein [Candidatus Atelocyanobacterium thalassa]KFF41025.1 MAG: NHL repeat protein [Candidatus Atelocyanobacterium thalassa isolate SIO64986]BDA40000.1 hypothetical protein CPARK_000084000 [cyanobacterium endosymbiont of Braarudosphaera bigelowii]
MEFVPQANQASNITDKETFLDILNSKGAEIILGETKSEDLVSSIHPSPTTMFGPRGACLFSEDGPLWVCDTGHHRLLGWKHRPKEDGQAADWIIGQPDFYHEGQNAKSHVQANTLNVPTGICSCGEGLVVADAWNHRVLIWNKMPSKNNTNADIVLGQNDFNQNQANQESSTTAANKMHWPYGVMYFQDRLFVADTGNRRVLVWNKLPTENGQPADYVLGQLSMNLRDENGGEDPNSSSLRWPHALTIWNNNLVVTDAGNNRIMIWDGIPTTSNIPCNLVLGQKNFRDTELNQSNYFPSSSTLSMPYGVAIMNEWLISADTANSRLLGWKDRPTMGQAAQGLNGQSDFKIKNENRFYGNSNRNSLSWPYGITVCKDTAVISDSGNNRVLLWRS